MKYPALVLVSLLVICAAPAQPVLGQVVARQGEKEEAPPQKVVTEFDSPMVLELPLSEVLALPNGAEFAFKGLYLYECEGNVVRDVKVTKKSDSAKKGLVLSLEGQAANKERSAENLMLDFELVAGGNAIAKSRLTYLTIPDGTFVRPFDVRLEADPAGRDALLANEQKVLRLTMHVQSSGVRESDEAGVAACEFLGTVTGYSGWGGLAAPLGAKGSIRSAKKRAKEMGGTHIVFSEVEGSGAAGFGRSTARAYRCQG